jgi:hypothetical protein
MKMLLFVLFAVMAATLVIGLTVAMTRSGEVDATSDEEATADAACSAAIEDREAGCLPAARLSSCPAHGAGFPQPGPATTIGCW